MSALPNLSIHHPEQAANESDLPPLAEPMSRAVYAAYDEQLAAIEHDEVDCTLRRRKIILAVYQGEGWRQAPGGFKTFGGWGETRLAIGKEQLYRHLRAAWIDHELHRRQSSVSTGTLIPEKVAREIPASLPIGERTDLYERTCHELGRPPTAREMRKAAIDYCDPDVKKHGKAKVPAAPPITTPAPSKEALEGRAALFAEGIELGEQVRKKWLQAGNREAINRIESLLKWAREQVES